MQAKLLLLPGAFHGSWSYQYIIPILNQLKYQCFTVDYPRTFDPEPPKTVDHYVQHTSNEIDKVAAQCSLPLFLICHSLGGLIGTNCAEMHYEKISGIILIAAAAFQNGKTGNSTILRHPAVNLKLRQKGIKFIDRKQRLQLRDEYIQEMLCNDCDKEQTNWMISNLVPEVLYGNFAAKWSQQRYGNIPKLYIQCSIDNMMTLPIQQHICNGLGLSIQNGGVIQMNASHSPWLSKPQELSNYIDKWIKSQLAIE